MPVCRQAPLCLAVHARGGFDHDGRFAHPAAVVEHYNRFLRLCLTASETQDLIEYLQSL